MLNLFAALISHASFLSSGVLLAQTEGVNPGYSWAIVLFFIILGLIATLSPIRRTSEIKRPKHD